LPILLYQSLTVTSPVILISILRWGKSLHIQLVEAKQKWESQAYFGNPFSGHFLLVYHLGEKTIFCMYSIWTVNVLLQCESKISSLVKIEHHKRILEVQLVARPYMSISYFLFSKDVIDFFSLNIPWKKEIYNIWMAVLSVIFTVSKMWKSEMLTHSDINNTSKIVFDFIVRK